jgi:hypothetical protein
MMMIISKEEENSLNKEDQKLKPQNRCSWKENNAKVETRISTCFTACCCLEAYCLNYNQGNQNQRELFELTKPATAATAVCATIASRHAVDGWTQCWWLWLAPPPPPHWCNLVAPLFL